MHLFHISSISPTDVGRERQGGESDQDGGCPSSFSCQASNCIQVKLFTLFSQLQTNCEHQNFPFRSYLYRLAVLPHVEKMKPSAMFHLPISSQNWSSKKRERRRAILKARKKELATPIFSQMSQFDQDSGCIISKKRPMFDFVNFHYCTIA